MMVFFVLCSIPGKYRYYSSSELVEELNFSEVFQFKKIDYSWIKND